MPLNFYSKIPEKAPARRAQDFLAGMHRSYPQKIVEESPQELADEALEIFTSIFPEVDLRGVPAVVLD